MFFSTVCHLGLLKPRQEHKVLCEVNPVCWGLVGDVDLHHGLSQVQLEWKQVIRTSQGSRSLVV